jgi:hypothetical protein
MGKIRSSPAGTSSWAGTHNKTTRWYLDFTGIQVMCVSMQNPQKISTSSKYLEPGVSPQSCPRGDGEALIVELAVWQPPRPKRHRFEIAMHGTRKHSQICARIQKIASRPYIVEFPDLREPSDEKDSGIHKYKISEIHGHNALTSPALRRFRARQHLDSGTPGEGKANEHDAPPTEAIPRERRHKLLSKR